MGTVPSGHAFELVYWPVLEMVGGPDPETGFISIDHPRDGARFLSIHHCWAVKNRHPRDWFLEN